jgi:hypothetical protein
MLGSRGGSRPLLQRNVGEGDPSAGALRPAGPKTARDRAHAPVNVFLERENN